MSTQNSAKATGQGTPNLSYYALLYSICQEEDIELQFLSTNWLECLTKNGVTHYIMGHKYDLNSNAASLVADDKVATYEVLKAAQIPAAEHKLLYEFSNQSSYTLGRNNIAYLQRYFAEHNNDIVIKPNRGMCGRNTFHITEAEQLGPALVEVFYSNPVAAICPFYRIRYEYRTVLLDDEVRLSYKKVLQRVGDWKFNLQHGASAEPTPKDKIGVIAKLARAAASKLGLRFCSVDVIETFDDELMVLEVNSGVMTDKYLQQHPDEYEQIKNLHRDAIRKMFE